MLIFFPFFAVNLRYQLGYVFGKIIDMIGHYSLIGGGFLLILYVMSIFIGKTIRMRWLIAGIVLLWIGCWCTGLIIEIFGIPIGEATNSGGYGYY